MAEALFVQSIILKENVVLRRALISY